MPSNYVARTETEKALLESLKQLEMQCKERVDLLEALKQSRIEAAKEDKSEPLRRRLLKGKSVESLPPSTSGWLGDGTVAPLQFTELSGSIPALPPRPPINTSRSTDMKERAKSIPQTSSTLGSTPTLPVPTKNISRSPSPDAGRKIMRTTLREEKKGFRSVGSYQKRPAPVKAAGLAWDSQPQPSSQASFRDQDPTIEARLSATAARRSLDQYDEQRRDSVTKTINAADYIPSAYWRGPSDSYQQRSLLDEPLENLQIDDLTSTRSTFYTDDSLGLETPPLPGSSQNTVVSKVRTQSPPQSLKAPSLSYRREYPATSSKVPSALASNILNKAYQKNPRSGVAKPANRKPIANESTGASRDAKRPLRPRATTSSGSEDERPTRKTDDNRVTRPRKPKLDRKDSMKTITPPSTDAESHEEGGEKSEWEIRVEILMKNLPKGVDENAAKSIFNEIVVQGDEVHWDDVAGLEGAKKALKEAVVYPFLRPDLFMGLREPARGMLLFGPPGTGKTMLARAVATESKSTFFAISASSLTSKWHGDSEKLVRALFAIAKALAPSIIFVDEIDSLLSSRSGSSEHEASRRSKTEFLIQWSDLQRAAAGRDTSARAETGDPSRVLVLAATNVPWDIDEAARRRFVRRQYIPLPEAETRETQIRTLLGHQRHSLSAKDIRTLTALTDGEPHLPLPSRKFFSYLS
jgi:fidgetin-like protein 1